MKSTRANPTASGTLVTEPAEVVVEQPSGDGSGSRVEIALINRSRDSVTWGNVTATCGCTVAEPLATSVLRPGERVKLFVNASPPSYGIRRSALTIETDSPATPALHIPITLKGKEGSPPFVSSVSGEIRASGARPGATVSRNLDVRTVESRTSEPWLLREQFRSPELSEILLVASPRSRVDSTLNRQAL